MKKLALVALALLAIQVSAQEKSDSPNKERGQHMERYKDYTPEEMASLQTKKMTLHLDLNESQQREIQKINLENAIQRKANMEAWKAKKEDGSMTKPSKEDRLAMMNQKLDHQIAMKAKMKKILNDEQFTKWEKAQQKMDHRKKGMKKEEGKKRGEKAPKQE